MARAKALNRTRPVSAPVLALLAAAIISAFSWACGTAVFAGEVVSGTSVASLSTDPGFEGYWKYCLTISWDAAQYGGKPHDLSHISIVLDLGNCDRACSPGYFAFADTAGSSLSSGCTVHYCPEFNCKGDPTIPDQGPTIKFEPYAGCETGVSGTATVCFYSLASPKMAGTFPSAIWIKFGLNVAYGTLQGALPNCIAPTADLEQSTWGAIKALLD